MDRLRTVWVFQTVSVLSRPIRSDHKRRSVTLFSISRTDAAYTCQYCKYKIILMFIVNYDLVCGTTRF